MNAKQRRQRERAEARAREQRYAQMEHADSVKASVVIGSAPPVTPVQTPPVVESDPDRVVLRTATVSAVTPMAIWNGRLQHPDPVLRQFGGQYGMAFYRLMLQQNLGLSSDCSQWEDRTNAIDRKIKAGKPGDETSEQMARDVRSIFSRLLSSDIVNLWILRARWYGVTALGKAGWKKDEQTGLLAPFDVYNVDPWRWKFGPNFEPYLLTHRSQYDGEAVDPSHFFFPRWGSLFTAYGESDLRDVYLSCWYTQNVQEMLLQSLEILGRPIPWINVPSTLGDDDGAFDRFEAGIAAQYKHYVITKTPGLSEPTKVEFPNMGILQSGGAGRSELEFIRYHAGLIQRKILGSQQTQDKVGGSRALEESRLDIASDKTPPGSTLMDKSWTNGWILAICMANWPNQPRELWPVMDSSEDAKGDDAALNGAQVMALAPLAEQLRLNQVTPAWAVEVLVKLKFSREKAEEMVASMVDPKSGLSKEPSKPVKGAPVLPPEDGEEAA